MDLLDQIDSARFLGREWLLYLWYESERIGAIVKPPLPQTVLLAPEGVEPFQLYVTSPLVLESSTGVRRGRYVVERVSITGTEPDGSAEAGAALREGKLPVKMTLMIVRGEREWSCALDGDTLALSSVKVPAELKKGEEAARDERLYLLNELEQMLDALLQQYVRLRLSEEFSSVVRPAIHAWIHADVSE